MCEMNGEDDTVKSRDIYLDVHTHMIFILNSSFPRILITKVKGGSGLDFLFKGIGMFPAQRIIYQFPRS